MKARRNPETEAEQQLLDYLNTWQQLRQKMPRPAGFVYSSREDFLLQHGEFFEPHALPHGLKRGEAKACFNNALMHCGFQRDAYVEGAALAEISDGLGFPTEHAWNVTRGGLVIDTTWTSGIAYFGVRFPYRTALRAIAEGCTVLDNYRDRFQIYRKPFKNQTKKENNNNGNVRAARGSRKNFTGR